MQKKQKNYLPLTKQLPFSQENDEKSYAKELILKLNLFAKNVDLNTKPYVKNN